MLLGLDVCIHYQLVLDTHTASLHSKLDGWTESLQRKHGHLFWTWDLEELCVSSSHIAYATSTAPFTLPEIRKLHYHFFHPSAKNLYNLVRRAQLHKLSPHTLSMLHDISRACATCTCFSSKHLCFKVAILEEKIVLNHEVALELFWLDGKPVLHVVDLGTGFSNALFLQGQSVSGVWSAFTLCWCTIYVGHPHSMCTDSGSVYTSQRWHLLTNEHGIDLKVSGVEYHNSLGLGERYQSPLRRLYQRVRHDAPDLSPILVLRLATKAMNDTVGPEGFIPSHLVFGSLPRFPAVKSTLSDQANRLRALEYARTEYASIVARLRVQEVLRSRLPPASNYVFVPGGLVHVYREGDKQFIGPLRIIRVEGKEIYVKHNNRFVHYNISQAVPSSILLTITLPLFFVSNYLVSDRHLRLSLRPLLGHLTPPPF